MLSCNESTKSTFFPFKIVITTFTIIACSDFHKNDNKMEIALNNDNKLINQEIIYISFKS